MSVPKYGRVTPLQADMLALGGDVDVGLMEDPTDGQRVSAMGRALSNLRRDTGQDFGYDLEAWHHYLISSKEHSEEYTFHYAWKAVEPAILALIHDADRHRLVQQIEVCARDHRLHTTEQNGSETHDNGGRNAENDS
jgi:hypothetical protein